MLEVLAAPAEYAALSPPELRGATCVVFDILRATTTIVTALANGAEAVLPVLEIADALAERRERPDALLAGERNGRRLLAAHTGGMDFELGNSPREFTPERVQGRFIVTTTTNGTRALRACAGADEILVGSFLNLAATAAHVRRRATARLLLVCAGTGSEAALEDLLAAGALCAELRTLFPGDKLTDAARVARTVWEIWRHNLMDALAGSRNGRRLNEIPELRADLPVCARRDTVPFAVALGADGAARRLGEAPAPAPLARIPISL